MKKVRALVSGRDITKGKEYEIIKEYQEFYTIKDDAGDNNNILKKSFEEVKEPNHVMVRDKDYEEWQKRMLIHDLGSQFLSRYITIDVDDENYFLKGENDILHYSYVQMKPINEVEQKIEELEQELAELKQQINK